MSKIKILITGSTGFIGRNFKEKWENDRRYVLLCPTRQELNLLEAESIKEYLDFNKVNVILHTANTNNMTYVLSDYDILQQNLRMFYNLEKCHQLYDKMYYFGSGAEYDMQHYIPNMPEEYFGAYIPKDPYGFAKYTMSRIAQCSNNIYDLRLFGVYGKYEQYERRFISNNICRGLCGMPLSINQNMYFDYLFVDDLIKIMEWFIGITPRYHTYNLVSGLRIDLLSIAKIIQETMELKEAIRIKKEGLKPEYTGNNNRLTAEYGKLELTSFKEAIYSMVQYYKNNKNKIDFTKIVY